MGKKRVSDCKSGSDFAKWVEKHPDTRAMRQSGSHLCVKGSKPGTAVIPVHNGDMPNGTRRSVIKMLVSIGLGCLFVVGMFFDLVWPRG